MGNIESGTDGSLENNPVNLQKRSTSNVDVVGSNLLANNSALKLVILGSGQSGKSSLYTQFLFNVHPKHRFDSYESANISYSIHINLLTTFQKISDECFKNDDPPFENPSNIQKALKLINIGDLKMNDELKLLEYNDEVFRYIQDIYVDQKFRNNLEKYRETKHVPDGIDYFLKNIKNYSPTFVPSFLDAVFLQRKTTGMPNFRFRIKKPSNHQQQHNDGTQQRPGGDRAASTLSMGVDDYGSAEIIEGVIYDVGGQKSERKKWQNILENVDVVLYVINLGEYDRKLYEDEKTNRLDDSLELFKQIVNSPTMTRTNFILIFNKMDVFRAKFDKETFLKYFPGFQGSSTEDGLKFIQNIYKKQILDIQNPTATTTTTTSTGCKSNNKRIITQFTCSAIQVEDTRNLFNAIQRFILENDLSKSSK